MERSAQVYRCKVPACSGLQPLGRTDAFDSLLADPPLLADSPRIGVLSHLRTFLPRSFADTAVLLIHDDPAITGSMSADFGNRLAAALGLASGGDGCTFLVWDGYDHGANSRWVEGMALEFGRRKFYAYWGLVEQWSEPARQTGEHPPYFAPAYWLSHDERWIVASDIDANFSLVGFRDNTVVDRLRATFRGAQVIESRDD